jgi:subtilisin family serine protease
VVLIAAAGNAGPSSPPLYPGADPNVIAVTATDSGDAIFAMANRGSYIVVASPGVDILALAPGEALQLTTGTSVATAHVSGLAALLLECKPSLKPADIRAMLAGTAKPLGSGAKLVNAYRAVTSLNAEASEKDGSADAKQ